MLTQIKFLRHILGMTLFIMEEGSVEGSRKEHAIISNAVFMGMTVIMETAMAVDMEKETLMEVEEMKELVAIK